MTSAMPLATDNRMQFDFDIEIISYPYTEPFSITGHTFTASDAVQVTVTQSGVSGRGEAIGVYYTGETAESIVQQLETIAPHVNCDLCNEALLELLPSGGARNALDCALWDLRCKLNGTSIWDELGIAPHQLTTVATVGIGTPDAMAAQALRYAKYPNLKIKLNNDRPIERLEAIREVRPDAELVVDVNQGWSFAELKEYVPQAERLGVAMIEQPLKRGGDEALEGYTSRIPLGADESCLDLAEYAVAAKRYDVINIKLDKCGGLTEGLQIVKQAQADGKGLMVGNMMGSSLSMAPSYVIGQFCRFVDIDGPLLMQQDIANGLEYLDKGFVELPTPALWG